MFPLLDRASAELQIHMADKQISKAMVTSGHIDVVLEEDDGEYEKGDTFLSFHHQAARPISRKTMLTDYLSAWLKRCVIPSPPHDGITPLEIFPGVELVHRTLLGLLLLWFAEFRADSGP